jgi:hypothetical protein
MAETNLSILMEKNNSTEIPVKKIYRGCLLVFLLSFLVHLFLFNGIIKNFVPEDDEIPLIVHSTYHAREHVDLASWFTEGYKHYFMTYPEWMSEKSTDFMRPMVNLVYYVNYILFKDNWGCYFLFSYLLNSLALALVFWVSRKYFSLGLASSALSVVLFFIISSEAQFYLYPSFITDALVGVILLAAFIACSQQRLKTTIGLLLLAFLTKEIAIFAPFIASITYLVVVKSYGDRITRKKIVNAVMISVIPYTFFLTMRIFLHSGFSGTIVTRDLGVIPFLKNILRGLAYWPSYIAGVSDLNHMNALPIAINAIFVLIIFLYLVLGIMRWREFITVNKDREEDLYRKLVILWVLGSAVPLVCLALEKRYAYACFIFLIPLLVSLMNLKKHKIRTIIVLLYLAVASFGLLYRGELPVFSSYKKFYFTRPELFHQLMGVLEQVDVEKDENVYLVNDRSGIFGAAWLLDFARKKKTDNWIVLNCALVWSDYDGTDTRVTISTDPDFAKTKIKLRISPGILYWFPGTDKDMVLSKFLIGNKEQSIFKRNDRIYYKFYPGGRERDQIIRDHNGIYLKRRNLEIEVADAKGKIVYFDFRDKKYKVHTLSRAKQIN